MNQQTDIARRALRASMRARRKAKVPEDAPLSVYDFAEQNYEVQVWFVDAPSLEGMYQKDLPGRIIVSSHRPAGRQAMTCAHELGHHIFGHGTQVDEYIEDPSLSHHLSPDEKLARHFASFLLMPAPAVEKALQQFGCSLGSLEPVALYMASQYLGVSYEGLIQHMRWSLKMIQGDEADRLLKSSPKSIKSLILEEAFPGELIVAGSNWIRRAIDLSITDAVVLPNDCSVDVSFLSCVGSCQHGNVYHATRQGVTRVEHAESGWASFIRISKKQYSGRNIYRHMEDPDECG